MQRIYLSNYLSIHLSIYPSIHLSIYPSIHLSIYLCVCVLYVRRKFRSQTSDNMDRWKAEQGRGREKRKIRREKIRRERVRRKKMQMREKVGKSRNTVFFQWFVAPEGRKVGSLKRRVRSQLARWEMKICTPLWREAHFEVKMYKCSHQCTPLSDHFSDHFWQLRCRKSARRCGAKQSKCFFWKLKSKCTPLCTNVHTSFGPLLAVEMSKKCTPLWREAHLEVKMYKTHHARTTFGSWDVEKVHAVVARSTFRSQNVQSTPASDHFWQLRCRKSARRCGAKHISKSKCTKHTMFGPLLEVEMSKICTPLWREAHFEVKMFKTLGVRTTFGGSDVASLHYTTLHYTTLHYRILQDITLHYTPVRYITLHYTPVHSTTLNYTTPHYITLHYAPLHYTTLHHTTLHYTPLHYITLYYTIFHYTSLPYTTLQSITLQLQLHNYTPLHSTTLNYTTLHYIPPHSTTPHYIALHYITLNDTAPQIDR